MGIAEFLRCVVFWQMLLLQCPYCLVEGLSRLAEKCVSDCLRRVFSSPLLFLFCLIFLILIPIAIVFQPVTIIKLLEILAGRDGFSQFMSHASAPIFIGFTLTFSPSVSGFFLLYGCRKIANLIIICPKQRTIGAGQIIPFARTIAKQRTIGAGPIMPFPRRTIAACPIIPFPPIIAAGPIIPNCSNHGWARIIPTVGIPTAPTCATQMRRIVPTPRSPTVIPARICIRCGVVAVLLLPTRH